MTSLHQESADSGKLGNKTTHHIKYVFRNARSPLTSEVNGTYDSGGRVSSERCRKEGWLGSGGRSPRTVVNKLSMG